MLSKSIIRISLTCLVGFSANICAADLGDENMFLIVDKEIRIEGVSRQSTSTVVNMSVENCTDLEWEILEFKGTCSCFKQARFQRILPPRQKAVIPLEFDFRSYSRLNSFSTLVVMSVKNGAQTAVVGPIKVMGSFVEYENILLYPPRLELQARTVIENERLGYVLLFKHKSFTPATEFRPVLSNTTVNFEAIQINHPLQYGDYEEIARYAVTENAKERRSSSVQSVYFDMVSASAKQPIRIGGEIKINYPPFQ